MSYQRSTNQYDYIIVGSGIAGLCTALLAREYGRVLVVTKGSIDDCNTRYAQGGIAAPIARNDSPELHFKDTIAAGVGLCDEAAVRILVAEAADSITNLVNLGVPFDTLDGEITLTMEAAHSVPRILHAGGDATGEHIEVTLSQQVRSSNIRVIESSLATEILVEDGVVTGIKVLDGHTGSVAEFGCRYLILAMGGAGQLFKFTTNTDIATGDGISLAFQAGAEITDMEFFQFHPTALHMPGVAPFLISEAVRGEGGILRNVLGNPFMMDYSPQGDMAPRDVVARSILFEMGKTGADNVFIDVTHLPQHTVTNRFPHIYRFCLEHGLDILRSMIPVSPAAHYMIGGIKTNSWGETNIRGLFACGETACAFVHGANRLASNSLLEAVVFSRRIVNRTTKGNSKELSDKKAGLAEYHWLGKWPVPESVPSLSLPALQQLLWENVGIIRNKEGLTQAASTLAAWQKSLTQTINRPSHELSNLILAGRLTTEAALLREESRGAHYRTDFPRISPLWYCHSTFLRSEGG